MFLESVGVSASVAITASARTCKERPLVRDSRSFGRTSTSLPQVIDDSDGKTLASASTVEKSWDGRGNTVEAATKVGTLVAERAKDAGVSVVVFDRGGNLYHGRIAALADAARDAGLEF